MYGMTHFGKIFSDKLTNWLVDESIFKQSHFQMFVYYKYESYGSKLFVLSYLYDFLYWYTSEELRKWCVDKIGKRLHVKLLGYAHWFMSIGI